MQMGVDRKRSKEGGLLVVVLVSFPKQMQLHGDKGLTMEGVVRVMVLGYMVLPDLLGILVASFLFLDLQLLSNSI